MDSTMTSLMTLIGICGIIQGLGMKYSKSVRKKLKLDSEKINKKYINFKINFLIFAGILILIIQLIHYFSPELGNKLYIPLSAFLLTAITVDMVYRKSREGKSIKK